MSGTRQNKSMRRVTIKKTNLKCNLKQKQTNKQEKQQWLYGANGVLAI